MPSVEASICIMRILSFPQAMFLTGSNEKLCWRGVRNVNTNNAENPERGEIRSSREPMHDKKKKKKEEWGLKLQ